MSKRGLIIILIFLLSISCVYAQGKNVVFTLKDIDTNEVISDAIVYITLVDDISGQQVYDGAININKTLDLALEGVSYEMVLKVDLPETPGKDYFGKKRFDLNNIEQEIFLFPAGSLTGIVKDKFDNVVGYAELSFECVDDIGADFPQTATKFGSISVDVISTGLCRVFASYADSMGFEKVILNQGDLVDIEIKLDKKIIVFEESSSDLSLFIVIIVVLGALLFYIYRLTKKERKLEKKVIKEERKEKEEEKEIKKLEKEMAGKRAKDIMLTLNAKEKSVVNCLLNNNNQAFQAKIRYETGIPRTSLLRVLSSLESKKIIHIEKHGKLVRVKLTPWFLEKE